MQMIAMLTMLIDHIGVVFYPDNQVLRMIGRLAFPLYAYLIVVGYQRTRNIKMYVNRLLLLAGLSQLPFMLALNLTSINAIGTLLICLLVLVAMDRFQGSWLSAGTAAAGLVLLEIIPFDYGAFGLMLVLTFRYIPKQAWVIIQAALCIFFQVFKGWSNEIYSVISTAAIVYTPDLLKQMDRVKIPRWLWRSFYPAHLTVLALILIITNGGI